MTATVALKGIPKYNSHCHLGGEVPLATVKKYASPEQMEAIQKGFAAIVEGHDYEKAFFIFPLISQVINTLERLKEAAFATCERMKADNNRIVLMRTGLKLLEGKSYEEYLKAVLEGFEDAASEDFCVRLLLSLKRTSTLDMAKETVDLALQYRGRGVVGIDISDVSTKGDINTIMPELLRAKGAGLKIAVHMGESVLETDQMTILEKLEPDLIDHGVNLCDEAVAWVKAHKTPVTVCLTSSIAVKMHEASSPHPWIAEHLRSGHPIDLGTDDSTVFGDICLTDEFERLASDQGVDKATEIMKTSFERAKKWMQACL